MANLIRQLPPLDSLPIFEAAYRLGSFTRAADEVALSQASVSRRIRELESDLGVSLFTRRRHDVVPTPEGEMLAASVHLTLRELASTATRLRSTGASSNSFTIFSDISLGAVLVAPIVSQFQQLYPDINIRVLSSYQPISELTEHFDVALQVGCVGQDRFLGEPIADDLVFPVCSPAFASRLPSPTTPDDLTKLPLLHLEDVGRDWIDWRHFLDHFECEVAGPIDGLIFSSYQVCLDTAERGEGVALGWARTVQPRLDEGKLVRIPGIVMTLQDSIYVYRSRTATSHPVTSAFVDTLRASIEAVTD